MPTLTNQDMNLAHGNIRSLSNTAAQVIIALQMHAETLRKSGDFTGRAAFLDQSYRVADAMAAIQQARDRLRLQRSLKGPIAELTNITVAAKAAKAQIAKIAKALGAANDLIKLLNRLLKLVT
ncbi:hypothetical protein [Yoonia sp. SDW83-1]|uniref:hypothetical protein n=1 Tax=Yoonia sp. SDW83-1 TaxID=3366945 RepID=UPI00398C26A7